MTDLDSRTGSGGASVLRLAEGALPSVAIDVAAHVVEEPGHVLTAVVSRDVGVQILPDALDAVGVGAVGRQEVKDDPATEGSQSFAGRVCLVDAVVVDDEVDAARAPVATGEQPKQLTEQRGVLAGGSGDVQASGADVERPGQVELLVLARRHDAPLVTAQHPVATDLGVEVDVDLVAVEHGLFGARPRFEPADRGQNTLPSLTTPGAQDDGLGRAESGADARQGAAHRADRHHGEALDLHLQAEQLARPCWSRPSVVLRRETEQTREHAVEALVGLDRAVVAAPVIQAPNALCHEPVGRTDHRGHGDVQLRRRLPHRPACPQPGNGLEPKSRVGVTASTSEADQLTPLNAAHSRYVHRARLLLAWVFGDSQTARTPRVFPSFATRDRGSRSVI